MLLSIVPVLEMVHKRVADHALPSPPPDAKGQESGRLQGASARQRKMGWRRRVKTSKGGRSMNTFESVLAARLSRRGFLKGVAAGVAISYTGPLGLLQSATAQTAGFAPVAATGEDRLIIPPGYSNTVLLRWGDPLAAGALEFDPMAQTGAKQDQQFGYNNDYVAFMPLPQGSGSSTRGLLVVNNETVHPEMIFPGWDGRVASKTAEMVEVEMAAVGLSIAEVVRGSRGEWTYVRNSPFNRRITAATPMAIRGPAAGHPLMQTSGSTGIAVLGTFNNCAGGVTPWGTVLSGEENIQDWFTGRAADLADPALRALHQRYGVGTGRYGWHRFHERFDLTKEPHEPNRFGWIVEVDPYDPRSMPVKRTALGRFIHEGAATILAHSGQPVAYMGDDGRYEYVYKFVSSGRYDPSDRQGNMRLLDSGTLYAARFKEDGSGEWLPLVFGRGPLTPANGFRSQAEVLINARGAADLVDATKMDRPEDVEANPVTGKVYVVMTSNDRRRPDEVNRANPRATNRYGHIIELVEDGGDHTATRFRWEIFILGGDPNNPAHRAYYRGRTDVSVMANPDNLAFNRAGWMWVATDGMEGSVGERDGLFAVETGGPLPGRTRRFLSSPPGAEVAGPEFTPDNRTLFVAIQHPGRISGQTTYARPASRWPDYRAGMPPRPSVVAIYREDGGLIGD